MKSHNVVMDQKKRYASSLKKEGKKYFQEEDMKSDHRPDRGKWMKIKRRHSQELNEVQGAFNEVMCGLTAYTFNKIFYYSSTPHL